MFISYRNVCFCFCLCGSAHCQFIQSYLNTLGCQLSENTAYYTHGSQQMNWVRNCNLKSLSIHLKLSMTRGIDNQLVSLHCKACRLPWSVAFVPVACPQSGNPFEPWVWGGVGETIHSNILSLDSSIYFYLHLPILHTAPLMHSCSS